MHYKVSKANNVIDEYTNVNASKKYIVIKMYFKCDSLAFMHDIIVRRSNVTITYIQLRK